MSQSRWHRSPTCDVVVARPGTPRAGMITTSPARMSARLNQESCHFLFSFPDFQRSSGISAENVSCWHEDCDPSREDGPMLPVTSNNETSSLRLRRVLYQTGAAFWGEDGVIRHHNENGMHHDARHRRCVVLVWFANAGRSYCLTAIGATRTGNAPCSTSLLAVVAYHSS